MLRNMLIGNFNPFEWDAFKCPVCRGNEFVSVSYSAVFCNKCGARFQVRPTAGDPGCVVDCYVKTEEIMAPLWKCSECGAEAGFFEWQKPVCPEDPSHKMVRVESYFTSWKAPDDFPAQFYLILKIGDYCSGWLNVDWSVNEIKKYDRLGFPTQEEWDLFQEKGKVSFKGQIMARCAIL